MILPRPGTKLALRLARNKRLPIQTVILRTLYMSGIVGATLIAPNVIKLLTRIDRGKTNRQRFYYRISQATTRLARNGLIKIQIVGEKNLVHLTEKGLTEINKILIKDYQIPEQALWDGKWRLLIFDVREAKRKVRTYLRLLLARAGFVRLQDSVWVHPYPCDEFITLVRAYLKSGVSEIRIVLADAIESDGILRRYFKL